MIHGFIISRLQGLHVGHMNLVETALRECDHLTIIMGSANKSRSIKNPWTAQERADMLLRALEEYGIDNSGKLSMLALVDFDYHDNLWEEALHQTIKQATLEDHTPVIFTSGKDKDALLRYSWARDVNVRTTVPVDAVSATKVREFLLNYGTSEEARAELAELVPESVLREMIDGVGAEGRRALYRKNLLKQQDAYIWKDSPYDVQKCATDNIVFDDGGHVLLVLRKDTGLWALPGGHLETHLDEMSNAIKELKEETGLEVEPWQNIFQARFSDPERCEIGRMTTTAFAWKVQEVRPDVKGADDAVDARWFLPDQIQNMCLYDDHYGIILTALSHFSNMQKIKK